MLADWNFEIMHARIIELYCLYIVSSGLFVHENFQIPHAYFSVFYLYFYTAERRVVGRSRKY
jgi:hypothetical protein